MLRITKLTDYAMVVLTQLGQTDSDSRTARELAERTRLPLPTVSKLLKDLTRAGLVSSQRGALGGYWLARAADVISVADVIDAVEGRIGLTECSGDERSCEFVGACPTESNWLRINQVVRAALAGITLADMARPVRSPLVHLSMKRQKAEEPTQVPHDAATEEST